MQYLLFAYNQYSPGATSGLKFITNDFHLIQD